ncbi:hypothetical protein C3731_02600 [Brucella oryzae]|uniref:Uncharacterized protein n=1 Tax=Brucella oryzae TaxID=335286 RepID=A0A2S7J4G5_9HYPH|nr:hypothetical protein C3731_02600 [Brucella oryzae]
MDFGAVVGRFATSRSRQCQPPLPGLLFGRLARFDVLISGAGRASISQGANEEKGRVVMVDRPLGTSI